MPYTPNYAAGDVLTAAAMNSIGEAWTSFTSTWTAATTNPAIGNGTITAAYCQINKMVFARYRIVPGSTTTFGSGIYYFSLPVTAASAYVNRHPVGTAELNDVTITDYLGTVVLDNTSRVSILFPRATVNSIGVTVSVEATFMTPTLPYTFGNADELKFSITYQAA